MLFVSLFLLSYLSAVTKAVVDLNPQEIQYVADHLTHEKCLILLEALHERGYWINSQLGEPTSPLPLRQDSNRPCVVQLNRWCNGPGKKMTFEFLALRLEEIGLKKVADTLSRKVLEETSDKLHRFFLDDPFKKMIPTKSVMLDKPPVTEKLIPAPDAEDKHENLFVAVAIMGTLCATLCLCTGICLGCPSWGRNVCKRACPSICSECFDIAIDNCSRFVKGTKRSADKYLFVSGKGGSGQSFLL